MDYYMICLRLFYAILGCCVGSFLCVCAYRLPRDMSLLRPGSHCDACGHPLGIIDLVPLVSYLAGRGRCRYCHAVVPARYFWREVETGLLFLLLGWQQLPGLELAVRFLLASSLLLISWLDEEEQMIYQVVLLVLGSAILLHHFVQGTAMWQPVAGAVSVGAFLGLFYLWRREGMGLGDIELGALLGLWLGPAKGLGCVFLGALLALAYVGCRMGSGDQDACHRPLPFSPFLVVGAFGLGFFWDYLIPTASFFPGLCLLSVRNLKKLPSQLRAVLKGKLSFSPEKLLVLRIEPAGLYLLEVDRQGTLCTITRQAQLPLARGGFSYEAGQTADWAEKLRELCRKKGFQAKEVLVSLPWEASMLRLLRLPELAGKKEYREAARWEILQHIPYEQDTFQLEAVPVPRSNGGTAVAVLPDTAAAFYRQLAAAMDWRLYGLVPDVTAWGRWLPQEPAAFCLTGSREHPVLTAYAHGCPVMTESVKQRLETSGEVLEKSLLWQTETEGTDVSEAAKLKELAERCGQWSASLNWGPDVPLYVFAPGCWPMEAFHVFSRPVKWLHGETRVQLAGYFAGRELPEPALWPGLWGSFLPAAEQAGPVFCPETLKGRWLRRGPAVARFTAAVTAALYLLALGYHKTTQWQGEAVRKPVSGQQEWTDCWQDWLKQEKEIKARSEMVKAVEKERLSWAGFFMLLGRLVPADCWVTRVTQEKPSKGAAGLHVTGQTLHKQSALQLVQRLKQHPMVTGVRLEKLQQEGKKETAGFAIFLQLKGGTSYES